MLFLGSDTDYWLSVVFTTKDDEQAAQHPGLVFIAKVCYFLLFHLIKSHLNHADSPFHNFFLRCDNGLGLLFLEHRGSNFLRIGQMGDFGFNDFDASFENTVLDRLTESFSHLNRTSS